MDLINKGCKQGYLRKNSDNVLLITRERVSLSKSITWSLVQSFEFHTLLWSSCYVLSPGH